MWNLGSWKIILGAGECPGNLSLKMGTHPDVYALIKSTCLNVTVYMVKTWRSKTKCRLYAVISLLLDVCQWRRFPLRADFKSVRVTMNSACLSLMTRLNHFKKNFKGISKNITYHFIILILLVINFGVIWANYFCLLMCEKIGILVGKFQLNP